MIFELSAEYKMLQQEVRRFVNKKVAPVVRGYEKQKRFPKELVEKLSRLGYMGVFVPEKYGGQGMDILAYAIVEEEIARIWSSLGLILSANNSLSVYPILTFGTEAQKKKYLPALANGKKLGCFALTEPDAGSDPSSISTEARKNKKEKCWNVFGTKTLITNASEANICILVARTSDDSYKGLTAFIIDDLNVNKSGVSIKAEDKMCLMSSPTCEMLFDGYAIPNKNVLGKLGNGFKIAMETLNAGRINIAAQAVGIAQGAYELALDYSKKRKQFKKPICDNQAIQFMLADMATEIDAARLLTYRAAWLKDRSKPFVKEASMAKLFASETAKSVSDCALQIYGGYGVLKDYDVERYWRDARVTTIYEGTSQIQRLIIARILLGGKSEKN